MSGLTIFLLTCCTLFIFLVRKIANLIDKKENEMLGKRMVAIFKKTKDRDDKWIDANMPTGKPDSPSGANIVIKKPLIVDGQVWDEGQTIEREDEPRDIGNKCIYCFKDTSLGSGRFVNRIPAGDDEHDGYACLDCQHKYDEEDE